MIVGTDGRTKGCLVQEKKRDDDSDWKFKYQSKELLKAENEEIVIKDNQEEFFCYKKQEGMDDRVAATVRFQQASARVQQSRGNSIQQSEDILDREIEFMRRLMVKVSQKKIAATKQRSSSNKRKIERECKSAASGARQNKIWKPGEVQKKNIAEDDQL